MTIRDNRETSPDIILAQHRLGRNQATLNIEMALVENPARTMTNTSGSASASSTTGGGVLQEAGGSTSGGRGVFCFSGGTAVRMGRGNDVPIRNVKTGADVLAPDNEGVLHIARVTGRTEYEWTHWLRLRFAGGRVTEVRPNHQYRSEAGVYVPARDADHVLHHNGEIWERVAVVERVHVVMTTPRIFYNLEIDKYRAYLANGDWVSNTKREPPEIFP